MEGQQLKEVYTHDDINLIDFLRTLWKEKLLILLTTSLFLFLGMAYIFFSTPVYEANGSIFPPSTRDLAPLNQGRSKDANALLPLYKVNEVYGIFTERLLAEYTKRLFFKDVFLPSLQNKKEAGHSQDSLFQIFSKSFSVKRIAETKPPFGYIITVRGGSPEEAVQWVQKYIDLTKQQALEDMLIDAKREQTEVVSNLQNKIDTIREVVNIQRNDRIEQLKEAVKLAQAAEVKGGNGILTDASAVKDPSMMHLRGSIALQAELNSLSKRDYSDAFAPNNLKLRETQTMLDFYKKIVISPDSIIMFRSGIDKSELPIAPRKKSILALALFAGLFLGIILATTRKAFALIVK